MRRSLPILAALAALPLLASAALAARPFPDTIALANGWLPEGIAAGPGLTAYAGSRADGGITKIDLRTGARDDAFVPDATGPAVGLEYEAGAGRLWVAGGDSGEVRVYDASSGEWLQTYEFAAGFVNDVVVTRDAAYATDSGIQQLLVVPLGPGGSLPDPDDSFALPITGDFVYTAGFNANGIESFGGWLLVPKSNTGELYAIDPATGISTELLPRDSVTSADGLLLIGNKLDVVRNFLNLIDVWQIRGSELVKIDTLTSPTFDIPTTVAFAGGSLWAVNARFTTPPTPDTPYWITQLSRH
jgi:outer membrane protein assembly factor BamB